MCVYTHTNVCVDVHACDCEQEDDTARAKAALRSYKRGIVPIICTFSLSSATMTERIMISLKYLD